MLKWPVVVFGALLLASPGRGHRTSSGGGSTGSTRHVQQGHRADRLQGVRTVPPAGRSGALQPHHLRRSAPACRADRGGHGEPVHAALEAGTGIWRLLRRTPAVGRPDRDDRPLGGRWPSRGRAVGSPRRAALELGLAARRSRSRRHASRVHAARRRRRRVPQLRRHRAGIRHTLRPRHGIPSGRSRRAPRQHSRRLRRRRRGGWTKPIPNPDTKG